MHAHCSNFLFCFLSLSLSFSRLLFNTETKLWRLERESEMHAHCSPCDEAFYNSMLSHCGLILA